MTLSGVQLTICRMGEKSSNFIDDIAHQSEDQPEVQLCHLCARHVCEEMYSQTLASSANQVAMSPHLRSVSVQQRGFPPRQKSICFQIDDLQLLYFTGLMNHITRPYKKKQ